MHQSLHHLHPASAAGTLDNLLQAFLSAFFIREAEAVAAAFAACDSKVFVFGHNVVVFAIFSFSAGVASVCQSAISAWAFVTFVMS